MTGNFRFRQTTWFGMVFEVEVFTAHQSGALYKWRKPTWSECRKIMETLRRSGGIGDPM